MPREQAPAGVNALAAIAAMRLAQQAASEATTELELYRRILEGHAPPTDDYDTEGAEIVLALLTGDNPEFRAVLT
jgi:hypothetical protein